MAMVLALEGTEGLIAIISNRKAAIATSYHLCEGGTSSLWIETRLKDAITDEEKVIGALLVQGHMGITGNERADRRGALIGIQGTARGNPEIPTHKGLKEIRKRARREARSASSYGKHRTDSGKHALAAYMWTRTNKGPPKQWLHHIKKANSPSCICSHPTQDRDHVTFHCPQVGTYCTRLLPMGTST